MSAFMRPMTQVVGNLRLAAAVSVVLLSLTGCSRPEFELGEVTGVVTYDDQPLARANVVFQPKGGIGTTSVGFTNDKGEYRLTFSRTAKGAIVGGHEVIINVWPTDENPKPIKVPARYNTATELSAEVKSGDNTFDFELTSAKTGQKKG
jgi:hypothetical protein